MSKILSASDVLKLLTYLRQIPSRQGVVDEEPVRSQPDNVANVRDCALKYLMCGVQVDSDLAANPRDDALAD